ncbi:hypothetical protein BHQ17_08995 [Mycolicibacterium holsaticum]|uniref:Acyl-CoA dehydrogenase C-terminal domain-containing protein n=2 Tax=Mycolicibacterium holsaticum TaxID=152142 RepID=A0A1E3RX72_9MYCO|nr:hypothetical protein BHQ17_08995 [Mycolicibacterium holsaticum]
MEVGMAEPAGMHQAVRAVVDAVTAESVAALRGSIADRMLQPARFGGAALRADEFIAAICELSALDGSSGWLIAAYNAAANEVAALPGDTADEIWAADSATLVATSYRADGRLDANGRLSGRWASVLGAADADWLLLSTSGGRRVLLPCSAVRIDAVRTSAGLDAEGTRDVSVYEAPTDPRHVFTGPRDSVAALAAAGMAAVVVGTADGVWRRCVDQMRRRLATSYGGDQVTTAAAAQVARAASDVDAAKLQVAASLGDGEVAATTWACHQAVARARDAADRLLAVSRSALDASDPVAGQWTALHTAARIAVVHLDDLEHQAAQAVTE